VAPPRDGNVDVARDRELVERCQAGDRSAFDDLYLRYQQRLHRFCMQRLGEPNDAEDVVQETFARAWRALPRFAGERRFYPWLTVIAGNLCVDTLRRRSRQTPVEESRLQAADIGTYETEDAILREVDSKLVTAAFEQLSERHRRVLQLREGSDWSYRQIAEYEGVGITAVETLLWRARQALRREFMLLDSQRGKLGSLVGFMALLRVRVLGSLTSLARRHLTGARHAAHHLAAALERVFGPSGALGVFGPTVAAASGVVVLGTLMVTGAVNGSAAPPAAGALTHPAPIVGPPGVAALIPSLSATVPATGAGTPTGLGAGAPSPATAPLGGPAGGAGTPDPSFAGGTATAGAPVVSGATGSAASIAGAVGSTASGLGSTTTTAVGGLGSTVGGTIGGLGSTVGGTVGGLGSTVGGTVGGLGSTVGGATAGLGPTVGSATGGLGSITPAVGGTVGQTVGGLTGTLGLPPLTGGSGTGSTGGTGSSGTSTSGAPGTGLLGLGG
jgi:RNA polymerase sigma-70 factor (ECF subfamily)